MTSIATCDSIDQFLKLNSSLQKKYWIHEIPSGLLCCPQGANGDEIFRDTDTNPIIGQIILPNLSWGCRLCSLTFSSLQDHQEHYKSISHLMNLKNNLNRSDEMEASEETNEDKNDQSDESSSDEDDPQLNSSDKQPSGVIFHRDYPEGNVRKLYTSQNGTQYIFHPSNSIWEYRISDMIFGFPNIPTDLTSPQIDLWRILSQTLSYFQQKNHLICILILRSGKFAASIFDSSTGKSIIHKVFRRYTVRAKAGGSQSSHDSKGRKAQSIGSQLRRYGEQALREDIYKLLLSWKDFLNNCSAIFMAIPKTMRGYIFHNDLPQDRDYPLKTIDSRVKFISFQVKKPIFEELCLVYEKCMMITFGVYSANCDSIVDVEVNEDNMVQEQKQTTFPLKIISEIPSAEEEPLNFHLDQHMIQMKEACEQGNVDEVKALIPYFTNLSGYDHLSDPVSIETLATLLHIVSERGFVKLVSLLLENGASPEIKDIRNRTPYHLCKNKETRDAFRRFVL